MIDLKQLEILDLTDRSAFQLIRDQVDETILARERRDGFEILRALEGRLRFMNPQQLGPLVPEYERLLTHLKFLTFADLTERDALHLLQYGLVDIFSTDMSLEELIRQRLLELPLPDRDDLKRKIRDAFIHNAQRLTSRTLTMGADNRPETPSVENWLRDYTYNLGNEVIDPFAITQYFSRNPNIAVLSDDERVRVKIILGLYERYKYPSDSVEGFDGIMLVRQQDQFYLLNEGKVRPLVASATEAPRAAVRGVAGRGPTALPPVAPPPAPPRPTASSLPGGIDRDQVRYAAEDERRYEEQESLLKRTGADIQQLIAVVRQALLVDDHETLVVALEVIARTGSLDELLRERDMREVMTDAFLTMTLGGQAPLPAVRQQLERTPTAPGFIALFLRWALLRAFSVNDTESARVGNQIETTIAALGNTSLVGMTYFDVARGSFQWAPLSAAQDGTVHWDA